MTQESTERALGRLEGKLDGIHVQLTTLSAQMSEDRARSAQRVASLNDQLVEHDTRIGTLERGRWKRDGIIAGFAGGIGVVAASWREIVNFFSSGA